MDPQARPAGFIARHRFVLLFASLLTLFLMVPIVHQMRESLHPAMPPVLEGLVFVVVIAGAAASVSQSHGWKIFALGLGLPAVLLGVFHASLDSTLIAIFRHLFAAAFLGYAIAVMLLHIFASRQVTFNTLCASLCIYLLLGVVWSLAYSAIDLMDPAAFRSTVAVGESDANLRIGQGGMTTVLYYSFTTLTTLGYGDIVPISPIARTLATVEAVTGQLYLTVLVVRLVGLQIADSLGQGKQPPTVGGQDGS